ncbi:hypothetical protein MKW92_030956 [Papaver armeniacum]|nr:hypothetical protein MKW92_030956 [Papaver armeniacum]
MSMAVRAINTCSISRSSSSSTTLRCRLYHFSPHNHYHHQNPNKNLGFRFRFPVFRSRELLISHGVYRSCSVHTLMDSVLEELEEIRARKRIRAATKVGIASGELLLDKIGKQRVLRKGLLLEFRKDSERLLLANGVTSSIKPQQVTYIIPGVENFNYEEISRFIQKAENNLDPTLLEYAWMELLEKQKSVTAEEMAEIIYGSEEPLDSYSAHVLLSKDEIYFSVVEVKGSRSVYGPRSGEQVEELLHRKEVKEAAEKELQEFAQLLKSAKAMPSSSKPHKESWTVEEKNRLKIEALETYAIDACKNDDQKKIAGTILKAMGLPKLSSSALKLLISIGYFPVHIDLDLLKLNVRTKYSDDIISSAEDLLSNSADPDETDRIDLTHLKVYAIDVDEADELDDALSARRLQDGRIQVWIHVADATRFVQPGSKVDREALRRATSIFLPTSTIPMFPEKLAMEGMSLKQGTRCNAVTVSVILRHDGSIAEFNIENSVIKPTYMLTYESATELLHLNLEEESELKLLSEVASLRLQWRREQGAIDTCSIEPRIKVVNPDDPEPIINLYVENQADPAMRLVSEIMIIGQPQSNIDTSAFDHLPEGPVRSAALIKCMRAAEMEFRKPARHGILGVPGYVQFTSPIRRYMDLLAHYQIKAFLREDPLPFSAGQLEGMASLINMHIKVARRLQNSSLRYWLVEYMRRQPKQKKFRALILKFIKDRIAGLLLVEVGMQASAVVSIGKQIGDEIEVRVEEAHPRDDVFSVIEVPQMS